MEARMDKRIPLFVAILLVIGAFAAGMFLKPPAAPSPTPDAMSSPVPSEPVVPADPYGPEAKVDLVRVSSLSPGEYVSSPLTIEGEARGTWYFEASFPVRLHDGVGNELAVGIAQAQDEWMTTEFVPFKVTLDFIPPGTAGGTLVFQKDNPSGLPEHDDMMRVPVRFNYGIVPPPAP